MQELINGNKKKVWKRFFSVREPVWFSLTVTEGFSKWNALFAKGGCSCFCVAFVSGWLPYPVRLPTFPDSAQGHGEMMGDLEGTCRLETPESSQRPRGALIVSQITTELNQEAMLHGSVIECCCMCSDWNQHVNFDPDSTCSVQRVRVTRPRRSLTVGWHVKFCAIYPHPHL